MDLQAYPNDLTRRTFELKQRHRDWTNSQCRSKEINTSSQNLSLRRILKASQRFRRVAGAISRKRLRGMAAKRTYGRGQKTAAHANAGAAA